MNYYLNEEREKLALQYGFECDYRTENNCNYLDKFHKDDLHIWQCIARTSKGVKDMIWQTAYLVDNHYTNHQLFDTLQQAFERGAEQ